MSATTSARVLPLPAPPGPAPVAGGPHDIRGTTPFRRVPFRLLLTCLLLLVSSVAWRKGALYSGGMDPVVVVKAGLGGLTLLLAITAPREGLPWSHLRMGPVPWVGIYLAVTCVGGVLGDTGLATTVLAVRVVVLATTVVLLFRCYPGPVLLSALMLAMLLLAAFAVMTGLGSYAEEGRLYGGVPPINANEIALLVGVPLICLFWRCANSLATSAEWVALLPLLGVIWLTGTRTGLAALLLAALLLLAMSPRMPVPIVVLSALSVPVVLFVSFLTPVLSAYATRGDTASTLTLNSRTVAWRAAMHYADGLPERVFGAGLAVKEIPVSAMYRSEQLLDSTWVSAIVQAGAAGTGVLAVLVLLTLLRAASVPRVHRSLALAVLGLLVVRSVLESGLFDASAAFIVFLSFAVSAQRPLRRHA